MSTAKAWATSATPSAMLRRPGFAQRTKPSDARQQLARRVRSRVATRDREVTGRFELLPEIVSGLGSCVLALSGGIDSSWLLAVAAPLLGDPCLAVTADSIAVPEWDRTDARAAAEAVRGYGTGWRAIATGVIDDPRYAGISRSRCYCAPGSGRPAREDRLMPKVVRSVRWARASGPTDTEQGRLSTSPTGGFG